MIETGLSARNRSDHVKSWDEFRFLPGVKAGLAALSQLGLPIVIVTNQAVVNRGIVTVGVVEDIHQRMMAEVTAAAGRVDRIMFCPHRPDEGCDCRKPKTGMFLQAAEELGITLAGSYVIGDAVTDLIAGSRVGCQTYLVLTGRGPKQLWPAFRALGGSFTIARDLKDAVNHILNSERRFAF